MAGANLRQDQCCFCGRNIPGFDCRSTREMEDSTDKVCFAALMQAGGGERSEYQRLSQRIKQGYRREPAP